MISYVSQRSGDNCLKLTISGHCPFKLQLLLPHRTRGSHSPERTDWSPGLQMQTLGKAHLGLGWCLSPAVCGSQETRLNTWHSLAGTTMTLRHLWVQFSWAPAFSKIICKLPLHGLILESQRLWSQRHSLIWWLQKAEAWTLNLMWFPLYLSGRIPL